MSYGYAYSLLRDAHLAEDAAQEAFVDAYRHLDDLRTPAAFPGWFRRVVFKHCDRITRGRRVPGVTRITVGGQTWTCIKVSTVTTQGKEERKSVV